MSKKQINTRYHEHESLQKIRDQLAENAEAIEDYVRELYEACPELDDKFMGHNDPLGNILCLLAHQYHLYNELFFRAKIDKNEQCELFPIPDIYTRKIAV